jgi:hypothetical protein
MPLAKLFKRRPPEPRLPNLVCVGIEKCGTTFLNAAFAQSPDLLTPRKKELFFFNDHFMEGRDWYLSWYDFASKPEARYVCDITPSYFRAARSLTRIRETLGQPKIIIVLRHPVYRSFSHYVHRLRHVAPRLESYGNTFLDEMTDQRTRRLLFPHYSEHLQMLLEMFNRQDILIMTYEHDILNPLRAQEKLKNFLDLDRLDFSAMAGKRVNHGKMPRFFYSAEPGSALEIGGETYFLPPGVLLLAHAKGTRAWKDVDELTAASNIEASGNWTCGLDEAEVAHLMETYYASDLDTLERDFGIDVNQWRSMTHPVRYEVALPDIECLQKA